MHPFYIVVLISLVLVTFSVWRKWRSLKRAAHIRIFSLPAGLFNKLQKHHPNLSYKECQLVAKGLRQFFLTYLMGGLKPVSMPSQVVDDLWHEFILYTKHYQAFCNEAFGTFMHHTPA
ncbi:MAG: glycine-rich domain-containing protein, partial [Burkholderiales bacterium]